MFFPRGKLWKFCCKQGGKQPTTLLAHVHESAEAGITGWQCIAQIHFSISDAGEQQRQVAAQGTLGRQVFACRVPFFHRAAYSAALDKTRQRMPRFAENVLLQGVGCIRPVVGSDQRFHCRLRKSFQQGLVGKWCLCLFWQFGNTLCAVGTKLPFCHQYPDCRLQAGGKREALVDPTDGLSEQISHLGLRVVSGLEDLLHRAKGVVATRVGYIGGEMPDPTYARHYGHAEAVEVTFDPSILTYRALLELFFQIHDPTTYEQQGSDVGPSYRSAIFYTSKAQMDIALATIAEIEASGRWPGPVVSEINPEESFWEAEPEHQKYLLRQPGGYSCHFPRPTWRLDRANR